MKRWGILLIVLWLLAAGALADGGDSTGLDGMRAQEIYWSYPEALIEDYSEMTLNGRVYSLILFRHEGKQKLQISYRDEEEDEESDWTDWFTTEGALPQGERAQLETDGESVTISATNGNGERQSVTYTWYTYMPKAWIGDPRYRDNEWKNGFRLTAYDGVKLEFEHYTMLLRFADGDADVTLLTDMRYVCYENLPKTLEKALENGNVPPGFCYYRPQWNTLTAQVAPLLPDQSRKVYLGPGDHYPRAGNGKATVGTNGWVQVFGQYKGWLLIQYHIDNVTYRIGWINDDVLPAGAAVPELKIDDYWPEDMPEEEITEDCALTDDPMGCREPIAQLKAGQKVNHRAFLCEEWELVTVKIGGKYYWGFVPSDCMSHG